MHGSPGTPNNWLVQIDITAVMNELVAKHLVGPMIVVLPAMNDGTRFEECVDAPGARDDTYVSADVPADVRTRFRAATVPAEWGIAGYSSGGYCAANLALRHRDRYGAAGIMDGYFRPNDGPAAAALHSDPTAEAQNDPLAIAQHLSAGTDPLPSLWLSAGTGNARDDKGAKAFVAALHGVEAATLVDEPGAGHNYYAWRPVVPRMLAWMWTQLAPPELRVQFPVAGRVTNEDVVTPVSSPSR
jgi:enterochelin esterase-like enzyme